MWWTGARFADYGPFRRPGERRRPHYRDTTSASHLYVVEPCPQRSGLQWSGPQRSGALLRRRRPIAAAARRPVRRRGQRFGPQRRSGSGPGRRRVRPGGRTGWRGGGVRLGLCRRHGDDAALLGSRGRPRPRGGHLGGSQPLSAVPAGSPAGPLGRRRLGRGDRAGHRGPDRLRRLRRLLGAVTRRSGARTEIRGVTDRRASPVAACIVAGPAAAWPGRLHPAQRPRPGRSRHHPRARMAFAPVTTCPQCRTVSVSSRCRSGRLWTAPAGRIP